MNGFLNVSKNPMPIRVLRKSIICLMPAQMTSKWQFVMSSNYARAKMRVVKYKNVVCRQRHDTADNARDRKEFAHRVL